MAGPGLVLVLVLAVLAVLDSEVEPGQQIVLPLETHVGCSPGLDGHSQPCH